MKKLSILLISMALLYGCATGGNWSDTQAPPGMPQPGPNTDLEVKSLSAGLNVATISINTTLTVSQLTGGVIPLSGDGTTVTMPAPGGAG